MRAKRRSHLEGPSAGRPVNPGDTDYQHLMECTEADCWYCNDRPEVEIQRDPEVQAWLDALMAQEQLAA